MEEILASIRRIIADDDSLPAIRDDHERAEESPEPIEAPPTAIGRETRAEEVTEAAKAQESAWTAAREESFARPPLRTAAVGSVSRLHEDETQAHGTGRAETGERRWTPSLREIRSPSSLAESLTRHSSAEASRRPEPDSFESEPGRAHDSLRRETAPAFENFAAPEPEAAQTLVSADAAAAVSAHFQALAASMVINDSDLLRRYAQEMLRPMLKQWLDDNLPVLVERLVRAEIERVARGRR
jgi:hypothetical protein